MLRDGVDDSGFIYASVDATIGSSYGMLLLWIE